MQTVRSFLVQPDAADTAPASTLARRLNGFPRALVRSLERWRQRPSLSLGLQGGGSFGAFTWGVLDRLLEEEHIRFDTLSGASAGAVNAVILASGLAQGGRSLARERLERFWRQVSTAGMFSPMSRLGQSAAATIDISTRMVSPYQFNPLGLNPLRALLAEHVNFEHLRKAPPFRLLIAATRVKDGRVRIFGTDEISLDAVLASACLPLLQHAVEIDGEWYWDGGYSANPPLRRLIMDSKTDDIVLVQVTPESDEAVPHLSPAIARRISRIAFNSPLQREVEGLADFRDLCRAEGVFRSRFCRKLERLRLHRIVAEAAVEGLHRESAYNVDWAFLTKLKDSGRRAAEDWLCNSGGVRA